MDTRLPSHWARWAALLFNTRAEAPNRPIDNEPYNQRGAVMKDTFIILIFLAALPNAALSETSQVIAEMGIGTGTCEEFSELYRKAQRDGENVYFTWAQGFISGWNLSQLAEHKPLTLDMASISTDGQQRYIRQYCNQHPLATYQNAVMDLMSKLKSVPVPKVSN